ncbi:AAA family ATPase [Pedobacter sp. L105]|uniref:AAA family ATPase n=1 Tax=Pedobacter sp. L105 TaxID=1641871 RepID=UPI00131E0314|nr:ATP-binding protein [Pedobacter sp. L105]
MANINNYTYLKGGHLVGYKSIEVLEVNLKKGMNLIIGHNGSGKSNFLEMLAQILLSVNPNRKIDFRYADIAFCLENGEDLIYEITRNISKSNRHIERVDYELDEREVQITQKLTLSDEEIFVTNEDELNSGSFRKYRRSRNRNLGFLISYFTQFVIDPLFLKFSMPRSMPAVDFPASVVIHLASEDEFWETDITTFFIRKLIILAEDKFTDEYYMEGERENLTEEENKEIFDKYLIEAIKQGGFYKKLIIDQDIIDNLRQFSPIQDIRFSENINIFHDERKITIENIKLEFFVNDTWIPWSQMSDGTKRMFYIISEVTFKKHGIILIEEPEIGIHPHQFESIMQFLKEQSEYKQFIISTHSPKALDHLDSDELDHILIAKYEGSRGTTLTNLNAEQMIKAKEYTEKVGFLSDYWLMSDLEG